MGDRMYLKRWMGLREFVFGSRLRVGMTGVVVLVAMGAGWSGVGATEREDLDGAAAGQLIQKMVAVEDAEALRRGRYMYLSKERSERTGGRLWTERVVETSVGKVRRLMAEDDQPLTGEREGAERGRLAAIIADPEAFRRKSDALKNDEQHAREMLELLPKAFLFEGMRSEGDFVTIDFKPNPDYSPRSMEERILHGMVGTLQVDTKSSRLHRLEGRLPADVNIGFGLVATIKAGSNFSTVREAVPGNDEWKTAMLDTDITGRAIFFKSIGKKEHSEHAEFVQVPTEVTVAQAVEMAER
jgi:hypothetical protein